MLEQSSYGKKPTDKPSCSWHNIAVADFFKKAENRFLLRLLLVLVYKCVLLFKVNDDGRFTHGDQGRQK